MSLSSILRLNATQDLLQKPLQHPLHALAHPHRRHAIPVVDFAEQARHFGHALADLLMGLALEEEVVLLLFGAGGRGCGCGDLLAEEGEVVAAAVEGCFEGGQDDGVEGCSGLLLLVCCRRRGLLLSASVA